MKKESLGKKVKRIREVNWLTQAELSVKSGLSIGTIWRIENDKGKPYVPTLKVLAKALKVSLKELL